MEMKKTIKEDWFKDDKNFNIVCKLEYFNKRLPKPEVVHYDRLERRREENSGHHWETE